ncbi:hypothetical protein DFQ26_009905 [Actinomortierella ambigua]|nr:hypothetical protein DFQ26_009905 [Actinomortierella ambigua]
MPPPPPHVPTILVSNSDNERDADDHQDWCLRNLRNPVFGRARKLSRHAPLELLSAYFTGPLPYSPWSPHRCCPTTRQQLNEPAQKPSSEQVVRGECSGTTEAASQKKLPGQALVRAASSETSQSVLCHPASSDSLCHQLLAKGQQGPVLSRQVSNVRTDEAEVCASASQLLSTMLSGEIDQDELDRVPVTPDVLQGQGASQQPTAPAKGAADPASQHPQSQAVTQWPAPLSRSTARSSPPIEFDDTVDSPANGGHGVSSAVPPQPGSSFAPESLSESLKPDLGEQQRLKMARGDISSAKNKRKEQGQDQDQDQERFQSQEDNVLMSVQEGSLARVDCMQHASDTGEKARTPKRARREIDLPARGSVAIKNPTSRSQNGSLKGTGASGPSPLTSSPIDPSPIEHMGSTVLAEHKRTTRYSSPTSSTLSPSMAPSSPLTSLTDPSQLHVSKGGVHGSETSASPSPSNRTNRASRGTPVAPNQSSLDVHLMDIEGYLERDLKGYASRLSY